MRFLITLVAALFLAGPAFADSDVDCYPISILMNPTEAGATDDYVNWQDGTFGTSEGADDHWTAPAEMRVHSLSAKFATAPGSGDTWTVSVVDDATAVLTCTVSGTATECINNDTRTIAKGSGMTFLITSDAGATDPTASAEVELRTCLDY